MTIDTFRVNSGLLGSFQVAYKSTRLIALLILRQLAAKGKE